MTKSEELGLPVPKIDKYWTNMQHESNILAAYGVFFPSLEEQSKLEGGNSGIQLWVSHIPGSFPKFFHFY